MLIAAAIWFTADGVSNEFLLNLMFYIIITPLLTVTLTKIMFNSENKMVVSDAISRIDSVMSMEPLSQGSAPVKPADHSVELRNVSYSYDGSNKALDGISLKIVSGQTWRVRRALRRRKNYTREHNLPVLRRGQRRSAHRRRERPGFPQGTADGYGFLRIPEQPPY